jgi:hypothetical protein
MDGYSSFIGFIIKVFDEYKKEKGEEGGELVGKAC